VILHSGVVVGSDGFAYVKEGKKNVKIPQIGRVEIEDDVEIGSKRRKEECKNPPNRKGRN